MVKIRVMYGGCGIEYTDEHGNARHALKTAEDGPFLCDNEQAERLVRLGVATYVTTKEPDTRAETKTPAEFTGRLDVSELEGWDYNQLKKLAADMGVTPKGKKKADLIEAIMTAEVIPGDEAELDEDDTLPELGAADPE